MFDNLFFLGTTSLNAYAITTSGGAGVIISNHDRFDNAHQKIAILVNLGSGEPHPYVLGSDATLDYFDVVEQCGLAGLARVTSSPRREFRYMRSVIYTAWSRYSLVTSCPEFFFVLPSHSRAASVSVRQGTFTARC